MSMFEYLKLKESVNVLKDNINSINTDLAKVKDDVNNMPNTITGFDGITVSKLLSGENKIIFPTTNITLPSGLVDVLAIYGKGYLSTLNFKQEVLLDKTKERSLIFKIIVDDQPLCNIAVSTEKSSKTGGCVFDFTIVKDKNRAYRAGDVSAINDYTPYHGLSNDNLHNDDTADIAWNGKNNSYKLVRQEFPISYRIGKDVFVADFMTRGDCKFEQPCGNNMSRMWICRSLNDILSGNLLEESIQSTSSLTYILAHTGIHYDSGLGIKFDKNFKVEILSSNPSGLARLTADYILL